MKVEIELEDIEILKSKLLRKEKEVEELQSKLKALSENELKEKAVKMSYKLFDDYMASVFSILGFDQWQKDSVIIDYKLLDKNWWSDEKISFEIGATISNKFKSAFISIIKLD